jgi:hypothetical protein
MAEPIGQAPPIPPALGGLPKHANLVVTVQGGSSALRPPRVLGLGHCSEATICSFLSPHGHGVLEYSGEIMRMHQFCVQLEEAPSGASCGPCLTRCGPLADPAGMAEEDAGIWRSAEAVRDFCWSLKESIYQKMPSDSDSDAVLNDWKEDSDAPGTFSYDSKAFRPTWCLVQRPAPGQPLPPTMAAAGMDMGG